MRKRILIHFIVIILTFSFVGGVYLVKYSDYFQTLNLNLKTISLGKNLGANFGEITSNVEIEQSFVSDYDHLKSIRLYFSTFNRENNGNTIITIEKSDTNEIVRQIKLDNNKVKDNSYRTITFDEIPSSKDQVYILKITSNDDKPGNSITVWKDNKYYPNTLLSKNDVHEDGTLVADLIYEMKFEIWDFIINSLFFCIINILMIELLRFIKNR